MPKREFNLSLYQKERKSTWVWIAFIAVVVIGMIAVVLVAP